jgi:carbon starvation protein
VGAYFTLGAPGLAIAIILYGFAASALPVWLLLAPRDYLSTFVKLGTIAFARGWNCSNASNAADAGLHQVH